MNLPRFSIILLAASAQLPLTAPAQNAGDTQEAVIQEVTVTARKRDESLSDVPLAVTAFSEADIERLGLNSLEDVSSFSPGLFYSEQGSQRGGRSESVIRFRGMDTNDVTPTRALASVFIDGSYVAGGLSSISLDEVSRVEVIKGPQSAYFGRTTFGGAVNFITRPIADEFEIRSSLLAAEDSEYDVSASVEGPIAETVAFRLGARYYSADGRYKSIADGGRLGAEETQSVSALLQITPTESLAFRLRGFYGEDDDGPATTFTLTNAYHNCGPLTPGGVTYICGELPVVRAFGTNTRLEGVPYDIYVNNSRNSAALRYGPRLDGLGLKRETARVSLSADWDIPSTDDVLSFSAGYNTIEQNRLMDLDYTPENIWLESSFQDIEDTSAELRYTNGGDRLRWMVGLSHFTLKFTTPNGASIGYLYPNAMFPNGFFLDQTIGTDDVETRAVFGSVSYDLSDTWNLSLEGRYQEDDIDEGVVAGIPLEETFTNFLPRAILQWQPTDDTNLYVTYAEGNKPGDFNNNLIALNPAQFAQAQAQTGAQLFVGEEELENYEIGLKQSLFERTLQLNLAAYFMDWRNQQTRTSAVVTDTTTPAGFRTIPVIVAAGRTDLWGLELETQWRATDALTLGATFNWAASEYKEFLCGFCERVIGTQDVSGNESPRFPEYSGSVAADYVRALSSERDWFVHADAVYTGEAWDEAFNLARTSAFWRVDLRGGIAEDNWRVELFVRNLFDDDNYLGAARFTDFTKGNFNLNDFTTNVSPADPRQVGVRIAIRL